MVLTFDMLMEVAHLQYNFFKIDVLYIVHFVGNRRASDNEILNYGGGDLVDGLCS